jgi:hypothetical protein
MAHYYYSQMDQTAHEAQAKILVVYGFSSTNSPVAGLEVCPEHGYSKDLGGSWNDSLIFSNSGCFQTEGGRPRKEEQLKVMNQVAFLHTVYRQYSMSYPTGLRCWNL